MTNHTETEHIEIIRDDLPHGQWTPIIGKESYGLMERLRPELNDGRARDRIQQLAASILGKCTSPQQPGGTTGLVLGQIQSGKTMSFTTLAAVARDNGYRIVIVITGTSVQLLRQSVDRLRHHLGIESGNRGWRHIPIEHAASPNLQAITSALAQWTDDEVPPHERRTLLITVLKQHRNLFRLTETLRRIPLEDVPTLIIDDEADQASLNTKVLNAEQSTTYMRILELRDAVPRHTFVQYTATPQALVLINIIDALSPRFIQVLEVGQGYRGGQDFFEEHSGQIIREIPATELPTPQQPLQEPPASFFDALRLFFVGVSAGYCQGNTQGNNRSMMIHPSSRTDPHTLYRHWVEQTKEEWHRILCLPDGDSSREEILNEFRQAADDLRTTEPNLPPDEELLGRYLKYAIIQSQVQVLNARGGRTPRVDWGAEYGLILIGGQSLDRGFTVKGLTVTYMPRSLGLGRADTLQQRGRFFGYRESYFGLCRIFLPGEVTNAFRAYVEHEHDLRERLHAFESSGKPLSEWPRTFILDPILKPTRDNLIDIPYLWSVFGNNWVWTKSPHITAESSASNARIIDDFCRNIIFQENEGDSQRTEYMCHLFATGLSLQVVLHDLLTHLQFRSIEDSQQFIATLTLLQRIVEHEPTTSVTVYRMSSGRSRGRRVDRNDRLGGKSTLFQGAYPSERGPRQGSIYPGDSAIKAATGVTVQIHNLTITRESGEIRKNVPAIAVWIPVDLARPVLIQPQGGA